MKISEVKLRIQEIFVTMNDAESGAVALISVNERTRARISRIVIRVIMYEEAHYT